MIRFTEGNLIQSKAEALVNTVNTVGVMGKGIALMFKEAFPDNFRAYQAVARRKELAAGHIFAFRRQEWTGGPKWIVNFATKDHWRSPSKIEWIESGLIDLRSFLISEGVSSIAIPPLGSGNGGLAWDQVRPLIENMLGTLDVDILIYEPTATYQNVAKRTGVEGLTPARALVVDLIRRYSILGLECTLLEIQKLVYFMQKEIVKMGIENPFNLAFQADKFGPYAPVLGHLLNSLDGSYLHCEKRITDAGPMDRIEFNYPRHEKVELYLRTAAKEYMPAVERVSNLIDGFETPLGMEILATVDWLINQDRVSADQASIKKAVSNWLGGGAAAQRKARLFEDRFIEISLGRLNVSGTAAPH